MLGNAPFIAWRLSGAGRLQWVNESYLKAVEGKSLDDVLDKQIMLDQDVQTQAQKVISSKEESLETRYVVVDGERCAMRILMFPLSGGVAGMAFDVSEEENARETLDRHVRAHDDTLNHVSDAVAIFGADRRLNFHNKHFEEMWGLPPEYLREKPSHGEFLDRLREKRQLPAQQKYTEWRAKELSYDGGSMKRSIDENMWSLPDGRTIQITRQKHPLGGILLLFKDITDQLSLQANYNALINQQRATMDKLNEAIAVFGGDGKLRLSNASFEELWKLDADELKANPDFDQITEKCGPLFHDKSIWSAIKGRVTNPTPDARQEFRGEMKRADGSIVTFLTQPLPDGATLIAFVDDTANRRVESALRDRAEAFEAADRLKTEFVQNVSYQLRSPLTTILGYAEFLESGKQGDLNDQQMGNVKSILQASDHLSRLIENILDLATIEAGRMDLDLGDIDIRGVIDQSVDMVVGNAADTKVSIKIDCPKSIGSLQGDERRIKQVLFNLLTNALRFTSAGDTIKIKAEKAEGVVRLQVSDNGKGIEYEQQSEAFDAFTSGDNRGAGLGLALVRSFVELHGGWVAIRSKPNKGATVIICLPEVAAPQNIAPALELTSQAVSVQ
jgi:signal transduction histidine kinase